MSSISRTHGRARTLVCAAALFTFALMASGVVFAQAAAGQKSTVDIMLTSKPSPPKTGENTFEVMVKDASGKPITDADVSAEFFMAKMGNMPEMKNTITLKHQKAGTYVGTGQVMMAGKWDVTVKVKRAGKDIGSKKFPVSAQ
jgi:hypothetical protein